ncbi:MAG: carboxypeptidase-like regulatory domain-containing protein [Flavobacteriaceae bacterium]|nr:carboxypeptidase-like regulatory domain-containing protein [Flavobacteriaceae bacterium]
MNQLLTALFCLFSISLSAQIQGIVTNDKGEPLPYVNIYLKDSYTGTTSNEEGNYTLDITQTGEYEIIFQFLGYTKESKFVSAQAFPIELNVKLSESSVSLDEVVISTNEDPAYRIIRETINRRKQNLERISAFEANFYSRGIWRVKDVPEKILGQEVGDFEGALDSTRTGIIYLSETISEIAYQKPDDFKERIIASKVSGDDNGFSFNSAQDANFSFYENSLNLNADIVSPIASNALGYYRYKLDGVFYEGNKLINKILVSPKRSKDRVWEGVIYIVEDDWQLYGVELSTNGEAIQVPFIKELIFKQNFTFDKTENAWVKISQTIDFSFGFLGFNGDGRFIAVYSDYNFEPAFEKKSFSNEVLFFEPFANKKDSTFWKQIRPVPLTKEEVGDYVRKDSIQVLRKSKVYLDSLDRENNKFSIADPLFSYTYRDTYEKWQVDYTGPLPKVNFNTVQGWNGGAGLRYFKWYDENKTNYISARVNANYGFSDDRLRFSGRIIKNFNRTNRLRIGLWAGTASVQFNNEEPISPLINSISTLFFQRNYMKLYESTYARVSYSQELFNGLRIYVNTGYESRKELFNTTDQTFYPQEDEGYTTNNPLVPGDIEVFNPAVVNHDLFKTNVTAAITFGQKYMTYPDGKFNLGSNKYPSLELGVENALGASIQDYNFTQLKARLTQRVNTGNVGAFYYNLKAGTFLDGDDISFVDYQHFNGNQTRVGTTFNYTNVFNLLPYYELSTNENYFEGHFEHNFQGWILGKIPGINELNFNLVAGAHFLSTSENKPYSELSIGIDNLGWGNFRFLRVDYVRSFYNGGQDGAFIFGLKFLNLFD